MINKAAFKELVDRYLQCVNKIGLERYADKEESYKFRFVANFQKNFDVGAENLSKMLETAIENNNLVVGNHYYPRAMLLVFAEKYERETRQALQDLFNGEKDVAVRIDSFRETMDKLIEEENRKNSRNDYSFMWMRFISLLLSARYPGKYYPVKALEYKRFAKEVDKDFPGTSGLSSGDQYKLYAKYAEELRSFIKSNAEIQKIHSLITKDIEFKDPEYIWMTQDVIYTSARSSKILGGGVEPIEEEQRAIDPIEESDLGETEGITEFVNSARIGSHDYEPITLRSPDKIKIRSIIEMCSKGELALPRFQRYFDWRKEDIRDFFISIFKGHYVGALLFWQSGKEPPLGIMPINGVPLEENGFDPDLIILDGQQRITSLYYGIKAPSGVKLRGSRDPAYFYIKMKYFLFPPEDEEVIVISNEKLDREDCYKQLLFPLYELENYGKWVDGFEDFMLEASPDNDRIRQIRRVISKRLEHMWEGFEIPYIVLPKSMDLEQAAEIFENLNTRGKPLSVFDLVIARMYKYGIDLRQLWDKTRDNYPDTIKRYHESIEKIPIYILQAISLLYSGSSSCKRKDILNMYENLYKGGNLSFEEHWKEASEYLDRAIKMIENLRSDGFGVKNEKEIPFEPMIPVLAALLKETELGDRRANCHNKIKTWYWASVFSNAYSQAADTKMTSDFKEMKLWFSDDLQIPKSVTGARRMFPYLDIKEAQYKTGSIYRGIISILAIEGSKDFETSLSLENARENDKDHIYPQAPFSSLEYIDSVLNITWMSGETNRRIKRHKKPSEYLKEFIENKYSGRLEEFLGILKTHFINKRAYEFMLEDERGFDGFLEERQKAILSKIKDLLGIESLGVEAGLITPEDPFKNKVMFGEVIQSCEEYLYWADKYFSLGGLKLLSQFLDRDKVKELKILTSVDRVDENFRSLFQDFKLEMKNKGLICDLRVIVDPKLKSQIHDRWIMSKDQCFNIPSPDTVARGQYSEIKRTENRPPFKEWWQNSSDIATEWNMIKNFIQ